MNIEEYLCKIELIAFDFDGVFTNNQVYVTEDGKESVCCWRSDGLGLRRMKDINVKTFIVSTEENPVVIARANKLGINCKQGVDNKAAAILQICTELGIKPEYTIFVGNDINDIPAFTSIGFPIAVADAYSEVDPHILLRTKTPGGFGAVREVCDMVFHAKRSLVKNKKQSKKGDLIYP